MTSRPAVPPAVGVVPCHVCGCTLAVCIVGECLHGCCCPHMVAVLVPAPAVTR